MSHVASEHASAALVVAHPPTSQLNWDSVMFQEKRGLWLGVIDLLVSHASVGGSVFSNVFFPYRVFVHG